MSESESRSVSSADVDDVLKVLAYSQCRRVLRYFRHYSTEVATVDDLVAFSADHAQEDGDENRVAIRLHHVTLPKLADAGVIDYDARSNTARYRSQPPLELWLNHVSEYGETPA